MIEYASNAIISAFTEIFAFMINYDFESRMSFNFIDSFKLQSIRERILQVKEVNIVDKIQKMIDFTKKKLAIIQERQKRHADSKRAKASDYKENDLV
jgi:hypothetical protein